MIRLIIALIIALPIYSAVATVSMGFIPVVMALQLLAGLDHELF